MSCEQQVIVYGPPSEPRVFTTAYCFADVVVQTGYCRRRHPHDDVRAVPALTVIPPPPQREQPESDQ